MLSNGVIQEIRLLNCPQLQYRLHKRLDERHALIWYSTKDKTQSEYYVVVIYTYMNAYGILYRRTSPTEEWKKIID